MIEVPFYFFNLMLMKGCSALNETKALKAIAGQVNLLALNATIEAARAGEAGKGFAVVATEVKNLASQTAKATDDIAGEISSVQKISSHVAHSVQEIINAAQAVNMYVTNVVSAIEQQSIVTQDISTSTQQSSSAVAEIAHRIKKLSAR
jgi:methyl-accepting chemotaxis protein